MSTNITKMRGRRLAAGAFAVALFGACGDSSDDSVETTTAAPTTSTASVPTTAPPTTEPAPSTAPLVVSGEVTAPPRPTLAGGGSAELLRGGQLLDAGTTYLVPTFVGTGVDMTVTASADGVVAGVYAGITEFTLSEDGTGQLVDIFDLGQDEVFIDPFVDFATLTGGVPLDFIEPAPEDYLAWIAERPGITAGPVSETEFAGHPARVMTYEVGEVEQAKPCLGADERGCLAGLTDTHMSFGYVDLEGTTVTVYQFEVNATSIVVAVSELEGASALADSLVVTERADPPGVGDAERFPHGRLLVPGTSYFWDGSSIGTYVFEGVDGVRGIGYVGDPFLPLTAPLGPAEPPIFPGQTEPYPCLSFSDGTVEVLLVALEDGFWGPGGPVGATVLEDIAALDGIEVVAAPAPFRVGDVQGTAMDITTDTEHNVLFTSGGLDVWPGRVTRVVTVEAGGGRVPDLVMVRLGTKCEAMFDSITVVLS